MSFAAKMRRLLATAALSVLFMASCTGVWVGMVPNRGARATRNPVTGPAPSELPVLFLTSSKKDAVPYVIRFDQIEDFKKQYPEFTFLVPKGQEADLNKALEDRSGKAHDGLLDDEGLNRYEQRFRVNRQPDGRQSLMVNGSEVDRTLIGWYVASAGSIQPQFYEDHGGPPYLQAMLLFPLAVGITFGIFWLLRRYFRARYPALKLFQ